MRFTTIVLIILKNIQIHVGRIFNSQVKPYKFLIQLTNDCNSKCKTCGIWKINKENPELRKNEMGIQEIEKLLLDWKDNLMWLSISGGEPTLSPHFLQTIEFAKKNCSNLRIVTFTTNAILAERVLESAKRIQQLGLDFFVVISLDGDQKNHDSIRGTPGSFQRAWNCYKQLKAEGIQAYLGLTLSDYNAQFVNENFETLRRDVQSISFVHSEGIYSQPNILKQVDLFRSAIRTIGSRYCISSAGHFIEFLYIRIALRFFGEDNRKIPVPCEVLDSSIHIWPNGDVSPCMFLPAIGSLKTDSIKNILHGPKALNAQLNIRNGRCPKCWMNCYAPHSMMMHPLKTFIRAFTRW